MDAREVIRLIIGILTAALICVIAAESSGQRSGRIQVASGQWVCKLIVHGDKTTEWACTEQAKQIEEK